MPVVNVYVDGFNLYYGALKRTPYKWLDLGTLCQLLLPGDTVQEIHYFTARVSSRPYNPTAAHDQGLYLRALKTVPNLQIVYGNFLTHSVPMYLTGVNPPQRVWVDKTEEKGSDVNLAAHLLRDAYARRFEVAVLITNDSDLAEPVRIVAQDIRLPVGLLNPHQFHSRALRQYATFIKRIRQDAIRIMAFVEQLAEQEQYRVALVLPRSRRVLLEPRDGNPRLPRISIPRWTRVAEQITKAIRDKWRFKSSMVIDVLPASPEAHACAIIEVFTDESQPLADGLISLPLDVLGDSEVTAAERIRMQKIFMGETAGRGPFSRLGWVEEAQEWIRASAPDRAIEFSDRQGSSAGGSSALVRFGTRRPPAYWLKATGAHGVQEYRVSTTLARLSPDCLPPLVAAREDWNAWVMEDAGRPLEETLTLPVMEQATHSLARLQIACMDHVDALFSAGCFDQKMPTLRASIPKLIEYLEHAMARQTSTRVLPIESKRLRVLELVA